MNGLKKFAAALTAVSVAATMTACSTPTIGSGSANAIDIDGYDVRAGVFIFYTLSAYYDAQQIVSGGSTTTIPTVEEVEDAHIDELEATDWIQNKATEYCQYFVAIEKEFEKIGAELTADELTEIETAVEQYAAYEIYADNGVGEESVRDIISMEYKRDHIFEYYYGFEGEKGVSEDELKDYFEDNFARVKYIDLSLLDSEGEELEEDDKKDIYDMAEDFVKRVNKKSTTLEKMFELDDAQEEYDEYVASQQTTTEPTATTTTTTTTTASDETTTTTTTDPYANEVLFQKITTTTADSEETTTEAVTTTTTEPSATVKSLEKLNKYVFEELELDKAVLFDDEENGVVYVVLKADIRDRMTEDDLWSEDYIYSIKSMKFGEDFEDYMEGISNAYKVVRNKSAYRRYSPFKLILETEA